MGYEPGLSHSTLQQHAKVRSCHQGRLLALSPAAPISCVLKRQGVCKLYAKININTVDLGIFVGTTPYCICVNRVYVR